MFYGWRQYIGVRCYALQNNESSCARVYGSVLRDACVKRWSTFQAQKMTAVL